MCYLHLRKTTVYVLLYAVVQLEAVVQPYYNYDFYKLFSFDFDCEPPKQTFT